MPAPTSTPTALDAALTLASRAALAVSDALDADADATSQVRAAWATFLANAEADLAREAEAAEAPTARAAGAPTAHDAIEVAMNSALDALHIACDARDADSACDAALVARVYLEAQATYLVAKRAARDRPTPTALAEAADDRMEADPIYSTLDAAARVAVLVTIKIKVGYLMACDAAYDAYATVAPTTGIAALASAAAAAAADALAAADNAATAAGIASCRASDADALVTDAAAADALDTACDAYGVAAAAYAEITAARARAAADLIY